MTIQELIDVSSCIASPKPPATAKSVSGTGKIVALVPQTNELVIEHGDLVVFKGKSCGGCNNWVRHLRGNGFRVDARDADDIPGKCAKLGAPRDLGCCHTTTVGGYASEGQPRISAVAKGVPMGTRARGAGDAAGLPGNGRPPQGFRRDAAVPA